MESSKIIAAECIRIPECNNFGEIQCKIIKRIFKFISYTFCHAHMDCCIGMF